jgi:hypothetical protein
VAVKGTMIVEIILCISPIIYISLQGCNSGPPPDCLTHPASRRSAGVVLGHRLWSTLFKNIQHIQDNPFVILFSSYGSPGRGFKDIGEAHQHFYGLCPSWTADWNATSRPIYESSPRTPVSYSRYASQFSSIIAQLISEITRSHEPTAAP